MKCLGAAPYLSVEESELQVMTSASIVRAESSSSSILELYLIANGASGVFWSAGDAFILLGVLNGLERCGRLDVSAASVPGQLK